MISSLPTLVVFERHWDAVPKHLLSNLLPKLADIGYNTLCYEAPENFSEKENMANMQTHLECSEDLYKQSTRLLKERGFEADLNSIGYAKLLDLIQLFVSSKRYFEVTERLKYLPGQRALKNFQQEASKLSFTMKGIDIDSKLYAQIFENEDPSNRVAKLDMLEDLRINTHFNHLQALQKKQEGTIFLCGVAHAENLMKKFKASNLAERIIYLFPHSNQAYDQDIEQELQVIMNDTLRGHVFCLKSYAEIAQMASTIIEQIKAQNVHYKTKIDEEVSHITCLREAFGLPFEGYLRPGYALDALVPLDLVEDSAVPSLLNAQQIAHSQILLDGRAYLAVHNINTQEIGRKIRQLA